MLTKIFMSLRSVAVLLVIGVLLFSSFTEKETVWVAIGDNVTYDGLHPSDKGNEIIAEKVVKTFRQIGFSQ